MNFSRRAAIPLALAMLVVSAVLASSAAATTPQWIVEGSPLAAGAKEPLAESTKVTETFAIKSTVSGVSLKVACTGMTLHGARIVGEQTRIDEHFKMEGCTFTGPPNCSVPSAIELESLTSMLEGSSGSFKLKFVPTVAGPVMTINISGAGCAIAGAFVVKGTMSCNYPGVETEAKNHLLEFSLTSGTELLHGTDKVTLTGKDEFWLTSNKNWKVA
jgi:hypothetical protein